MCGGGWAGPYGRQDNLLHHQPLSLPAKFWWMWVNSVVAGGRESSFCFWNHFLGRRLTLALAGGCQVLNDVLADSTSIACSQHDHFREHLPMESLFSLLLTTHGMAPAWDIAILLEHLGLYFQWYASGATDHMSSWMLMVKPAGRSMFETMRKFAHVQVMDWKLNTSSKKSNKRATMGLPHIPQRLTRWIRNGPLTNRIVLWHTEARMWKKKRKNLGCSAATWAAITHIPTTFFAWVREKRMLCIRKCVCWS